MENEASTGQIPGLKGKRGEIEEKDKDRERENYTRLQFTSKCSVVTNGKTK